MRQDGRYILGIHDGHNCGATLTRDGAIIASISEERLTREKNAVGYPECAIEAVLRLGGIDAQDLSEVVYASLFMHDRAHLQDITTWYAVGAAEQKSDANKLKEYASIIFERRKRDRIEQVSKHLGVRQDRIFFVEHHLAHLAAAYYTAPFASETETVLGLTCDGAGDNLCATVSICRKGKIERIAATDRHASLGKIYSRVTFLMGMTPWEHEYKLMGLAPYADPERADRAADALRRLLKISDDGLRFALGTELSTNYCYEYLQSAFSRVRFDTIAGATQLFTEEMLVKWVRETIRKTGIHDVVCGGGVFMNVKANMLLAQLPEVRSIYVMPSAADESLSIGACLYRYYADKNDGDFSASRLTNLYLGGMDDETAEKAAVEDARNALQVSVEEPGDMNEAIANLLANGEIVAVCRGRMEWGARALGNRSILSCAADPRRIDEINNMIKMRDFWMPFAPSIKAESAHRYFDLTKNIEPDFMTFAFPLLPAAAKDLAAGAHPKDRTIRPQVVRKTANPNYHAVIDSFERRTGRGGILNTSFNLHGEPIVMTSADAVRVLAKSGLRHLALNDHIISKVSQ
jgi:carbamoyltransferase